jgi:hypothetical protein
MNWSTRRHLHLDRVATPWLILRFIDRTAHFVFVDDVGDVPADATPFGFPGVELSSHDSEGTTFAKTMRRHRLAAPALDLLERMVAAGVAHALGHENRDPDPEVRALGAALDGIGVGMGALFDVDDDLLEACLPLYDALYVLCQARTLPADQLKAFPAGPPSARSAFLRAHIRLPDGR